MPRRLLDIIADGPDQDWGVEGASTAWEAVTLESDDSSYITSNFFGNVVNFISQPGRAYKFGRIMNISLHIRGRLLDPGHYSRVRLSVLINGTPYNIYGDVFLELDWSEHIKISRDNPVTSDRFKQDEVSDIGIQLETIPPPFIGPPPPPPGRLEISRCWLEIEYTDTPYFYDPFDGVLPDAITGPMVWVESSGGTATAGIIDNYLRINDNDLSGYKFYVHPFDVGNFPIIKPTYITEIETRVDLDNVSEPDGVFFVPAKLGDGIKQILFTLINISGVPHIGIIDNLGDMQDPEDYYDIQPIPDLFDRLAHFRLVVDRDAYSGSYGKVSAYVDHNEEPIVEAYHHSFKDDSSAAVGAILMGTTTGQECVAKIDYISWKTYKKNGEAFAGWYANEVGDNVVIVGHDDEIVRPFTITPPGITAGQSEYSCRFEVQEPDKLCRISQLFRPPDLSPTTYTVEVDYRFDIAGSASDASVLVQRTSDFYFWDGVGWSDTPTLFALINQTDRTRASAVTGLTTATADDFLISIQGEISGAAPYFFWIYKVYLGRETP